MNLKILGIILSLFITSSIFAQNSKELFTGENALNECLQDIPLTYKKKTDLIVADKAKELKNKEIILLQYDKKSGDLIYFRFYLISEFINNEVYNYLISAKDFELGKKIAVFLKFTPKYDRFYLAHCFDQVLSENKELKEKLKESK